MVSRPARLNPPMQSVRLLDPASGLDGVIAIHSTAIGPGAGGCRFWHYAEPADAMVLSWPASVGHSASSDRPEPR